MKIVPGRLSWLACVAAVSLLLTSRPAGAEPVTSGVVVANTGGKDTLQFRQWQSFRQALDEKTSGSILLDYLIFGELGGTRTMAEAVISGRADIGSFTCNGLTSLVPELAVTALPFLFGSEDEAAFVMDKYLTPAFSSLLDKRGLVFLQWSDFSWMDLYARIPVQLPAQLEGQDIRTIDNIVGPSYIRALAGNPVILSASESAMRGGQDKIFGAIGSLRNFATIDRPAYRYFTRTHHAYNCAMIVANKSWFNALGPAQQSAIRQSLVPPADMRQQSGDEEKQLLALLPVRGVAVLDLTAEQHNAWAAAGLPLYRQILATAGGGSVEIYDAVRAGKQDYLLQAHAMGPALPK